MILRFLNLISLTNFSYFSKFYSRISIKQNCTEIKINNSDARDLPRKEYNTVDGKDIIQIHIDNKVNISAVDIIKRWMPISFVNGIFHSEEDWRNITIRLEQTFGREVRPFYNPSSGFFFLFFNVSTLLLIPIVIISRQLGARCHKGRLSFSAQAKRC